MMQRFQLRFFVNGADFCGIRDINQFGLYHVFVGVLL